MGMNAGDIKSKHVQEVLKCHTNPKCRLDPAGEYYDWVLNKSLYMEQCIKAGVPMIPTVFYKNGFDPKQCMKDLEKYAKENTNTKIFLLQPYMLKPNGEVFDEVRNFFIDGQWRYSVFTHGTDGSDAGYYQEPDGPRKVACKALAERAYEQVLKTCTWQGKRINPLLNRIDIGVIPKKGGDSLHRTDNTYFVNEIELIMTTWLERYAPISVHDVMAHASIKHTLELLVGLLNSKKKVRDEAEVRAVARMLNKRLGPFKHLKI